MKTFISTDKSTAYLKLEPTKVVLTTYKIELYNVICTRLFLSVGTAQIVQFFPGFVQFLF